MSTKLIAEFCQNHNGSREVLQEMIFAISRAGFTHAKIQGLYSAELTKRDEFEDSTSDLFRPYDREFDRLRRLDLTEEDEAWFVEATQNAGLQPMITVFTHAGVERAKRAGFSSIKIASYDCASHPLIQRCAEFASELIVSTGATSWVDVKSTSRLLSSFKRNGIEVGLLHARTIYPALATDTGLLRMLCLKDLGVSVGFSDHSLNNDDSLLATKFALFLGARIIERHFTVLPSEQTKDGPVSITEEQAKQISEFAQMTQEQKFKSLGSLLSRLPEFIQVQDLEPTEVEKKNVRYYRGRVASVVQGKIINSWEVLSQ